MEKDGRPVTDISALNMYSKVDPLRALSLMVLMFSLAGIPPLGGFFAKFYIFSAVLEQSHRQNSDQRLKPNNPRLRLHRKQNKH